LAQLAWWLPNLLLGEDSMAAPVHVAREVGVFNAALGVGFCWVVARPDRAAGLLAVLGSAVGLLAAVEVVDLARGHVHLDRLGGHLLLAAGLILVVLLARQEARPPAPGLAAGVGRPSAAPPQRPREVA
jgi:predicted anti-sigma-YlaC factor YlaD